MYCRWLLDDVTKCIMSYHGDGDPEMKARANPGRCINDWMFGKHYPSLLLSVHRRNHSVNR